MLTRSAFFTAISGAMVLVALQLTASVCRGDDTGVPGSPQLVQPYGNHLALGYLSAPLVATGAAFALSRFHLDGLGTEVTLVSVGVGMLVPMAVHMLNDESGLGVRALLCWPLTIIAGGAAGGLLGVLYVATLHEPEAGEEFAELGVIGTGVVLGALVGAISWPIIDLADTYGRDAKRRDAIRRKITLGVAPHPRGGAVGTLRVTF